MRNTLKIDSSNSARTVNSELKRQISLVEPGLLRIDQVIVSDEIQPGTDVTGDYWIFGVVLVKQGNVTFRHGQDLVEIPFTPFAMLLPPFSITQVELRNSITCNFGFVFKSLPSTTIKTPLVFRYNATSVPKSLREITDCIAKLSFPIPVGREDGPSALSMRAKDLISKSYLDGILISEVAAKLRTSSAVLSRYFKRDYGLTPVEYRRQLQITRAMVKLMSGVDVITTAQNVGFNDLSNFYEQFRKIAYSSPAKYHLVKKSKKPKI